MNLIRTGAPEPRCMEDAADDLSGKTIAPHALSHVESSRASAAGLPLEKQAETSFRKKECAEPMKKSCLIAVVAVLAAVAGALGAVAIYLRRREKELDEYERLLFGEDDAATVEDTAEPAEAAEEAPAEDKAE